MTLKSYLDKLNDLVKANPDLLNFPVIYGTDEEGNEYHNVVYTPSFGHFEDGKFDADADSNIKNAICIN